MNEHEIAWIARLGSYSNYGLNRTHGGSMGRAQAVAEAKRLDDELKRQRRIEEAGCSLVFSTMPRDNSNARQYIRALAIDANRVGASTYTGWHTMSPYTQAEYMLATIFF